MSIRDRLTTHGTRTDTARTGVRVAADRKVTRVAHDETAQRRDVRTEAIEHALADIDIPIAEKLERRQVAGADARARAASDQARSAKDRADASRERERLAAIVDEAADGIVIVDAELRVIYANAAFADDLGGRASEMVGRSVLEVTGGALDATTIASLTEVARRGQPWLSEADRHDASGTVGRVQIRVTPRLAAEGMLEGYVVVMRDVTELREAERAARESENRYRSIVDGAAEGIYRTSREGKILAANPAMAAILGYDSADALVNEVDDVGRQLWADADDRSRILGLLDKRGTVRGYECRLVRKDGTPIWVSQHVTVVRSPDGRAAYYDGFVEDITERHRVRLERERLVAAVEQSADGVVITDPDWRIAYANAAYAASVGHESSELIGRSATEVVSIGLDRATVAAMYRTVSAGHRWVTEVDHRLPDGSLHRFETNIGPIHDPAGAITSWVGVIRDITERHHAEREMRRLAAAVEQSSDAVVITDASGAIQYINPAFEHVTGYTSDEVLGQNPRILKSGVQGPGFYAAMWATLASGQSFSGDLTNKRKDGSLFQEEAVISPIRDEAGTITSYVAVKRDVTERKRLAAERASLATAVEQATDYVAVTDAQGLIEFVNPAFERVTGYPEAEAIGRTLSGVLRSDATSPKIQAAMDAAYLQGQTWAGHVTNRRRDGSLFEIELSISPIRDQAGGPIGFVEIGRDRTHEREMEAEREREAQIRVALAESLATVPEHATLEQAAQAICDELVGLSFVDVAEVEIFLADHGVEMLAVAAPPGYPAIAGTRLPAVRAAIVRDRCAGGPWAGFVTDDPASGWIPGVHAAGLRALGYGPIVHGGHVGGALVLGTFDEGFARTLVEQMPGIASFGATSSALLGERMHARRTERELRDALGDVLTARAFHPVFQPIVDLETGDTMGYEALTRFDSGQRPDLCFADAWSVGLGPELELATLEAAVAAARDLPAGTWLDLNVSPRLLADPGHLREILWSADRALVLEVTEHELVGDYPALREAVRALGNDVRLAVDDAGAGVANFGHIVELAPAFVKLDISLIRRVNANMGRQAMVVGMRHFSRTAGCRLIAEGIETEDEAATLRALGVEFGQGYWLGRPEAVEHWTAARAPAPEPSKLTLPQVPDGAPMGGPS